ncbi:hypothetical protein [Comamonas sp. NoAH]|uniref:hypothetical protein n=1 Tax=Comamonas halotolerans TaxID=3041496 RepID=UPI0024E0745B|nr:hypothetical protein [Comamonas sp. NoAH]
MFSLWKPQGLAVTYWRDALVDLGGSLARIDATQVSVMVVDADVDKVAAQCMTASADPLMGMVSLWLDKSNMLDPVQAALQKHAARLHAYHVHEFVPYPEKRSMRRAQVQADVAIGQRTPGMCQESLFQRPAWLELAQWMYYWRDCHAFNAYALQSIFDCRQNIVVESLTPQAQLIHAIVEEHYPSDAIGSLDGFYGAQGDANLL